MPRENSGQRFICVINGTAAGGGYELALASDHIMLADDGAAAVSLPELPLLAVLPGTGGLTRVIDKRKVRRDHADVFCTTEEGVKGKRAVDWRLVDEIAPNSKLEEQGRRARQGFRRRLQAQRQRQGHRAGAAQARARRERRALRLRHCRHRSRRARATITLKAPEAAPPADIDGMIAQGARSGRCGSPANSTMRSCICASTSSRSR